MSAVAVSASALPFATRGIASAMPPVPVFVPSPTPSRRSHNSIVNAVSWRAAGLPKLAYAGWAALPERLSAPFVTTGVVAHAGPA